MPNMFEAPEGFPENAVDDGGGEWGFDDADQLETWVYRLDESSESTERRKTSTGHGYLATIAGPINPRIVKDRCAGGRFKLLIHRNRKLAYTRFVTIIGKPLELDGERASEVAAVTPTLGGLTAQQLTEAVVKAVRESMPAPAPPAQPAFTFQDALALADRMSGSKSSAIEDPVALATRMNQFYMDGMAIGQRNAGGAGGRSVGDAMVEIAPHLGDMVGRVLDSRQANPPLAAQAAAPANPAAGASPPATDNDVVVLAGMVSQAVTRGTEPADFADVLDVQLGEDKVAQLAKLPAAAVVAHLRRFAKWFPVLAEERAAEFIAAVSKTIQEAVSDAAPVAEVPNASESA